LNPNPQQLISWIFLHCQEQNSLLRSVYWGHPLEGDCQEDRLQILLSYYLILLYNIHVVTLRILSRPLFSTFRLQTLSAPVTHLDQGNELPLAPEGAPENNRYHTMSKTKANRSVVWDQPLVAHDMGKRVSQHFIL